MLAFPLLPPPQKSCNFPYLEFGKSQASFKYKVGFNLCFGGKKVNVRALKAGVFMVNL